MGRGRMLLQRLAEGTELEPDMIPGQPIVEIAGTERVLIEHHCGIMGYSRERILVKMKYGCLCVEGCGLELGMMSREQLLIKGTIFGVALRRKERA